MTKSLELRAFLVLCLVFAGLVVLLPAWTDSTLPADVVEEFVWSQSPQWGYYKHAPLMAWLAGLASLLAPERTWPFYFLSVLWFAIACGFLFDLVRRVSSARTACISVALTFLVYYFPFHLPQWNANIVQLPFWSGLIWAFWLLATGGGLGPALIAGLCLGLGNLGKYSFGVLPFCLLLLCVFDRRFRPLLWSPWTWIAGLIALAIDAGQIHWLMTSGVRPLRYTEHSLTARARGLLGAAGFAASQILVLLPIGGLLLLWKASSGNALGQSSDRALMASRLVLVAFFGPMALLVVLLAAGFHVKDHWSIPVHMLTAPAMLVLIAPAVWSAAQWKIPLPLAAAYAALVVLLLLGFVIGREVLPRYGRQTLAPTMDGPALAAAADQLWTSAGGKRPLKYVAGSPFAAETISFWLPGYQPVIEQFHFHRSPWISRDDVRRSGYLAVVPAHFKIPKHKKQCQVSSQLFDWPNKFGVAARKLRLVVVLPCEKKTTAGGPATRAKPPSSLGRPSPGK